MPAGHKQGRRPSAGGGAPGSSNRAGHQGDALPRRRGTLDHCWPPRLQDCHPCSRAELQPEGRVCAKGGRRRRAAPLLGVHRVDAHRARAAVPHCLLLPSQCGILPRAENAPRHLLSRVPCRAYIHACEHHASTSFSLACLAVQRRLPRPREHAHMHACTCAHVYTHGCKRIQVRDGAYPGLESAHLLAFGTPGRPETAMHACMHTHTHTHTHTHMYAIMRARTHTRARMHALTHTTHTHTHTCAHTHTCTLSLSLSLSHTHTHTHARTHAHTHTRMHTHARTQQAGPIPTTHGRCSRPRHQSGSNG